MRSEKRRRGNLGIYGFINDLSGYGFLFFIFTRGTREVGKEEKESYALDLLFFIGFDDADECLHDMTFTLQTETD